MNLPFCAIVLTLALAVCGSTRAAQADAERPLATQPAAESRQVPTGVELPPDYVIGPEDVLGVVFWREPDLSGDVTVRPDGRISLPVIGEIEAAGLRPEALKARILTAAGKYVSDANVAVVVRTINSRKVFITGRVTTPGTYPLTGPRTVLQLIALAGGLTEYADAKSITVVREENGATKSLKVNYKEISKGRSLEQNIQLKPGDTVVVP